MELATLRPKPDQRMMIVGASGTGKTTLARAVLATYERVLVIDPKCTYGGPGGQEGYTLVRTPGQLRRLGKGHKLVQYRPSLDHMDLASYDEVYGWAYALGKIMVYTDEIHHMMPRGIGPRMLTACITCGRELGVGMINGSQRPRGIDKRIYTESELVAAFRLRDSEDQRYMANVMGPEVLRKPTGHAFWFMVDGWQQPKYCQLTLTGGG